MRHHHQQRRSSTNTFLGAVGENPWVVNLILNSQSVKSCIDAGAEAIVIPEQVYQQLHSPQFPANFPQSKSDQVKGLIHHEDPERRLSRRSMWSRMGRPAIEALELVPYRRRSVQNNYYRNYSKAWGNWRASTPSSSKTERSLFPDSGQHALFCQLSKQNWNEWRRWE